MTRLKLALLDDDHVGTRHNILITGPAGQGFADLDVCDDDPASVLLPPDADPSTVRVRCSDCGVVLLEDEDYVLEDVEPWQYPTLKLV